MTTANDEPQPTASPEDRTPALARRARQRRPKRAILILIALAVGSVAIGVGAWQMSRPPAYVPVVLAGKDAQQLQADWAAKLKVKVETENTIGMKLILIPPGGEAAPNSYYLGKYEVTQEEWEKVMGYNASTFKKGNKAVEGLDTRRFPADTLAWIDGIEFCNKLSDKEGLKPYYELTAVKRSGAAIQEADVKIVGGTGYHLPTDAEWEHACRAGTKTKFYFGDRDEDLGDYAWYGANSGKRPHPVGEKKPNAFGLYDMHGNVAEFNEEMIAHSITRAPLRVNRGGDWYPPAAECAVSYRGRTGPAARGPYNGIRVARAP